MENAKIKKKLKKIKYYTILTICLIVFSFIISTFTNLSLVDKHMHDCTYINFSNPGSDFLSSTDKSDFLSYFGNQKDIIIKNHLIFGFIGIVLTLVFSRRLTKETKSLLHSENKYETLVNSAPFPIVLHSNNKLIFANEAAVKVMEYESVDQIISRNIFEFFHPGSLELANERINKMNAGHGESETAIEQFVTAKGNSIFVEVKAHVIMDKENPVSMVIFQNVTDRKIWIDKLRASEANLKSLLNNNRIAFILFDTNKNIVYYNRKAEELFEKISKDGLKKDEAIKHHFRTNPSSDFLNNFTQALIGIDRTYQLDIKKNDGETIYLLNDLHPVKTDRGEITGVVWASTDITNLKMSQIYLNESRERLKTIYTNTNIGIILTDNNGVIEYSNPAFSRIVKYTKEELNGKKITELTYTEDLDIEVEQIKKMKEGLLDSFTSEKRYLTKLNEIVWTRINISCTRNGSNSVKYLTGMIEDISDRKEAEYKLAQINLMKDILSNSILNSPLGMILWEVEDQKTKIIDWNNASEKIFGWTKDEAVNKNFFDLITTIPGLISKNSNTLFEKNENYPSCYLTESVTKDGNKITVNLHNTAMFDSHSGVIRIMSLVQDVTEQKLIEQELIKAKESAEKADRLKSEFLAQMSHEIRTPINAMLSFTSLIKEDVAEYEIPDLEQSFEIINSAGNRIIRTTDLLINMAEIQTNTHDFNPHVIDIKDDIIQNLYPIFKPIAKKKNLELNFINKADKTKVYADEYMLTKVFDNLIDNAIKFTNSGSVEILTSNISDSKIRIVVKDSGIGISEVYMKNLFKPFSQEESGYTRKFEGNGLGLALVKKYCELNNADISFESEKGKGTSFIIEINLA